jgi:hypothetical protein
MKKQKKKEPLGDVLQIKRFKESAGIVYKSDPIAF